MRKKEFLKRLSKGLSDCSRKERNDILDYYDELIEDTIDKTGKSEARVIDDLGSISEIIRKVQPENDKIIYDDPPKCSSKTKKRGFIRTIIAIIFSFIGVIVGIVFVALMISMVAVFISMLAGGAVLAYSGFTLFGSSITVALFRIGTGILSIGLAFLLMPLLIKIVNLIFKALKKIIGWFGFKERRCRS